MKVLWLCNIMLPVIAESLGLESSNKEGWLTGLSERIRREKDGAVKLGVCFPVPPGAERVRGEAGGVAYFSFEEDRDNAHRYQSRMEGQLREALQDFRPDVVHIFGTEYPHTLAMLRAMERPERALVGIQGLCFDYADYYMAGLPEEVCKSATFRDLVKRDSLKKQQEKFRLRGEFEKEALRRAVHVTGRTSWDRRLTEEINPSRQYHFMNETLRSPFYDGRWDASACEKQRIFMSQGNYPIKGLHFALEALGMLKEEYPRARLYVAGDVVTAYESLKDKLKLSEYGKYIRKRIAALGLWDRVFFLGRLPAGQMKEQYLKANLYLSPSAIENSPNSLGEAMLLGVPSVSSDVGGVSDMLEDGREGLLYESGDAEALAERIRRIFADPGEAARLGEAASRRASATHDPDANFKRLLEIYRELCGETERK